MSCRVYGALFGVARAGHARRGRTRPDQGIVRALVQEANSVGIEALLVNLEISPRQRLRRHHLHSELDRISGAFKSLVTKRFATRFPSPGREQLGFAIVVECNHFLIKLQGALAGGTGIYLPTPQSFEPAHYTPPGQIDEKSSEMPDSRSKKSSIRPLYRQDPLSGGRAVANRLIPLRSRHVCHEYCYHVPVRRPCPPSTRVLATSGSTVYADRADRSCARYQGRGQPLSR